MNDERDIDALIGRVLGGTYRIEERIGRGGMATVYRARHVLLDEDCAVKIVHPALVDDEHVRARFLREARILTLLRHPHVVHIRHLAEEDGLLYLAMDLCPGETLRAVLHREGCLPESRAVAITKQVLQALSAAHAHGIVHRDLKPENVIIQTREDGTDRVRVLDFGLARLICPTDVAPPGATLTEEGAAVGTVLYMSPEQVRASSDVGPASDLFSLGVMLYEMLSGGLPFESDSSFSVMMRIIQRPAPPLPASGPAGVSEPVRSAIALALEKRPEDRHIDAAAFGRALLGESEPTGVRAPQPAAEAAAPRRPLWMAGVVVVVVGLILAFVLHSGAPEPDELRRAAHRHACACAPGRAIGVLDQLVADGTASAADRLELARLRIGLLQPAADKDLDAAEAELGADNWRVRLGRALYDWQIRHDTDGSLVHISRALLSDGAAVEGLALRIRVRLSARRGTSERLPETQLLAMARSDLAELERRAPDHPITVTNRARLAARAVSDTQDRESTRSLIERAESVTERTLERLPRDPRAWMWRGFALARIANVERRAGNAPQEKALRAESVEALRRGRALLEGPGTLCLRFLHVALLEREAEQLQLLGRREEAVQAALALMRLDLLDARGQVTAANTLRSNGRPDKAIPIYEEVTLALGSAVVQFDLAHCRFTLGLKRLADGNRDRAVSRMRGAVKAYTAALGAPDGNPGIVLAYRGEARLWLARLEGEDGPAHRMEAERDMASALETFDRRHPDHPHAFGTPEIYHRSVESMILAGRWAEAIDTYSRSIEASGRADRRGYLLRLARLCLGAGWRAHLGGDPASAKRQSVRAREVAARARGEVEEPAIADRCLQAELAGFDLARTGAEAGERHAETRLASAEAFRAAVENSQGDTVQFVRYRLLAAEFRLGAREDAPAPLREALARATLARRAALARGELWLDRPYVEAMATTLEAAREGELAALAGRLAGALATR